MSNDPNLPGQHGQFIDKEGRPTKPFYDFLRRLQSLLTTTTATAATTATTVAAIPPAKPSPLIHGIDGVDVYGSQDTEWFVGLNASARNASGGGNTFILQQDIYEESWPMASPASASGGAAPTGTGLYGVTAGVMDAAAVTVGVGLSLSAGVLTANSGALTIGVALQLPYLPLAL